MKRWRSGDEARVSRCCGGAVAALSRQGGDVLGSDRQNPVLRPVPGSRIPEGAQAVKGWTRQRTPRSGAQPSGRASLHGRAPGGRIGQTRGTSDALPASEFVAISQYPLGFLGLLEIGITSTTNFWAERAPIWPGVPPYFSVSMGQRLHQSRLIRPLRQQKSRDLK